MPDNTNRAAKTTTDSLELEPPAGAISRNDRSNLDHHYADHTEERRDPHDLMLRAVMANEQIYDLFTNTISHRVFDTINQRQTRFFGVVTVVATLLVTALGGLASFYFQTLANNATERAKETLSLTVNRRIVDSEKRINESFLAELSRIGVQFDGTEKRLVESINSRFSDISQKVEFAIDTAQNEGLYLQFANMAGTISEGQSFTNEERDNVIGLLRRIHTSGTYTDRPEFPSLLEKVIDAFAGADIGLFIDQIVELFEAEMTESQGITLTLIQHYGQELIGSRDAPHDWDPDRLRQYYSYLSAAIEHNLPEFAFPFQMWISFIQNGRKEDKEVQEIFRDSRGLTDSEKATLTDILESYRNEKTLVKDGVNIPGNISRMIEVVNEFFGIYEAQIDSL